MGIFRKLRNWIRNINNRRRYRKYLKVAIDNDKLFFKNLYSGRRLN